MVIYFYYFKRFWTFWQKNISHQLNKTITTLFFNRLLCEQVELRGQVTLASIEMKYFPFLREINPAIKGLIRQIITYLNT